MSDFLSPLQEHDVRIPCDGVELHGDLAIPADPRALVVFAHGSGSSRLSPRNQMVARHLHQRKLATLLFDLLSPAESASPMERQLVFDIPFLTDRLIAATRWAQDEELVHRLPIGYFGSSTGAAAALSAAARLPEVRAVVSRGGRTDLAGAAVARVKAAVLLIVGELDLPVIEWNEDTLRQLTGFKDLALIPRASHLFQEHGALEQVAEIAAGWFECYLPDPTLQQADEHEPIH